MRRESLIESVAKLPWPVGVGLAVSVFVSFQIYQSLNPVESTSLVAGSMLQVFAYGLSGLFLFSALLSFLSKLARVRLSKATSSVEDVRRLSWRQFEILIGELFREQGYFVVETPEGPDNGIDLVLRKDGEKTYVQCKHWKANSVGVEKIRELLGAMAAGGAQSGIFVASGQYTKAAEDFARDTGIKLIGARELGAKFDEAQQLLARSELARERANSIDCPVCQSPMVLRTAKRGPRQGQKFWGCSQYPHCRGTRDW